MVINISEALKNPGEKIPFFTKEEIDSQNILGDEFFFQSVLIDGTYEGNDKKELIFKGKLSTKITSKCARCLEEASFKTNIEFQEIFTQKESSEDDSLTTYYDQKVDLYNLAYIVLITELPLRIFCRKDCKGLCQRCGSNLNLAECNCDKAIEKENPFSVLSKLSIQDEEV